MIRMAKTDGGIKIYLTLSQKCDEQVRAEARSNTYLVVTRQPMALYFSRPAEKLYASQSRLKEIGRTCKHHKQCFASVVVEVFWLVRAFDSAWTVLVVEDL